MIPCTRYVTSEASRCDAEMGVCGCGPTIEIVGWWLRCPVGTRGMVVGREPTIEIVGW
jgi:hypothetical protein